MRYNQGLFFFQIKMPLQLAPSIVMARGKVAQVFSCGAWVNTGGVCLRPSRSRCRCGLRAPSIVMAPEKDDQASSFTGDARLRPPLQVKMTALKPT